MYIKLKKCIFTNSNKNQKIEKDFFIAAKMGFLNVIQYDDFVNLVLVQNQYI